VSPDDVEPHFKLYIIVTLVPLFSSWDVLGRIYVFSPAFYKYSPYFSGNKSCACAHHKNIWEWSISPHILNFSTIFASLFTHSRNSPWSALDRRIGCLQSQSGCSVEETNLLPPLGIEPQFLDYLACSPATTLSYPASDYPQKVTSHMNMQ